MISSYSTDFMGGSMPSSGAKRGSERSGSDLKQDTGDNEAARYIPDKDRNKKHFIGTLGHP